MDIYKKLERFRKIFILSISAINIAIIWCGIYMKDAVFAGSFVIALVVISSFFNEMIEQVRIHKLTFRLDNYIEGIALTVVSAMSAVLLGLFCFLSFSKAYSDESISKWVITGFFNFLILLLCFVNLNNMLQDLRFNKKKEE